jgi:glycosyltransferase involved in cell wall biosynthesis
MKFSIVTISFNQVEFLEQALNSVFCQGGVEKEYIVVDPGSTDGSRELINRHREQIQHVLFEPDAGPADGLNKGFARATGEIFCYLNSDDVFEPGAFRRVAEFLAKYSDVDVVCGHAWVIDETGDQLRRVWSDSYVRPLVAYGAAIQIQPSTFIRAEAFHRVGGFNVANRISWDSDLLLNLALSGANIRVINEFLSLYRVHSSSITGAALHRDRAQEQFFIRFEKIMGRPFNTKDHAISRVMFVIRQLLNPRATLERLLHGPVYGRKAG